MVNLNNESSLHDRYSAILNNSDLMEKNKKIMMSKAFIKLSNEYTNREKMVFSQALNKRTNR